MTLRAYVTVTCAAAITIITALFYFQADYFLGSRFDEIESVNQRSIIDFSNTTIKAKKYLLSAYRESISRYPDLPKAFVLAHPEVFRLGSVRR